MTHKWVDAAGADARGLFRAVQAKGEGYAISTEAELQFTADVSRATGVRTPTQ